MGTAGQKKGGKAEGRLYFKSRSRRPATGWTLEGGEHKKVPGIRRRKEETTIKFLHCAPISGGGAQLNFEEKKARKGKGHTQSVHRSESTQKSSISRQPGESDVEEKEEGLGGGWESIGIMIPALGLMTRTGKLSYSGAGHPKLPEGAIVGETNFPWEINTQAS